MKTTNLELSKQLKGNGYPQGDSHFLWYINGENANLIEQVKGMRPIKEKSFDSPTADEILDRLLDIDFHETEYFLSIGHGIDAKWQVDYRDGNDGQLNAFVENSLADAAAEAWLFLKKENLL